jgi:hypothetical protein
MSASTHLAWQSDAIDAGINDPGVGDAAKRFLHESLPTR